jgi:hypothetical protein
VGLSHHLPLNTWLSLAVALVVQVKALAAVLAAIEPLLDLLYLLELQLL